MKVLLPVCFLLLCSCHSIKHSTWPRQQSSMGGREFYEQAAAMNWKARDSFAVQELTAGNMPSFLKKFTPIQVSVIDSSTGKKISGTYYVMPDYLSIGTDKDWARIPLTPMAAQEVADRLDCFLPTRKMVNDIYKAASIKLQPVPLFAFRDSTVTMWHHHLIIEGQRQGRRGLVAGIKKDVVISGKITREARANRVAIYGWHQLNGIPIQPLYTGHVNWWVDYSHGIRLIYKKIKVGRNWMNYEDVLRHPVLSKLLCDEENCDFFRYAYGVEPPR